MIIFMSMIFQPSILSRVFTFFTLGMSMTIFMVGIYIYLNYGEDLQIAGALILIALPIQFLIIGLFGLMTIKVVERKADEWVFTYKYRKKVIHLRQDTVLGIVTQKKSKLSFFDPPIFIKTNQGPKISCKPIHFKQFSKFSELLLMDFEDDVTIK
jgi:hypothetical protein